MLATLLWAYLRWKLWWKGDPAPLAYRQSDWVGLVAVLPLVPLYAAADRVFT